MSDSGTAAWRAIANWLSDKRKMRLASAKFIGVTSASIVHRRDAKMRAANSLR